MFDESFGYFGSPEDLEEFQKARNKMQKEKPKVEVKCVCGAKGKIKCRRCDDLLCGSYFCMVEHNEQKGHVKKSYF